MFIAYADKKMTFFALKFSNCNYTTFFLLK